MHSWLSLQMALFDAAAGAVGFAVNWLVQSTLLIIVGLVVGHLLGKRGSAVQSAVYRTTLVAVLVCPLATSLLSMAGVSGWSIAMPRAWTFDQLQHPATVQALDADLLEPLDIEAPRFESSLPSNNNVQFAIPESLPLAIPSATGEEPPLAVDLPVLVEDAPAQLPAEELSAVPTGHFAVHLFGYAAATIAVFWLAMTAALATRLAIAWSRLTRLRRDAVPADSAATATCRDVAAQLAVRPPAVLQSPFLPSPCLAGLNRPAVLLPEAALTVSLRDVLIHELAHLRRRDCHWNLLRQLASAALFFQPLLWILSRRLEATAEEVCDDYVVQLGGDRNAYASRLVDIAELSTASYATAGVGIVSLRSMLAQRVARIIDPSRRLSTRVGNLLLLLVLAGGLVGTTAVGLVGLAPRPSQAEPETALGEGEDSDESASETNEVANDSDENVFVVRGKVVDPDGRPVEGATIRLPNDVDEEAPSTQSDAHGRFEITCDKSKVTKPQRLASLVATAAGYGPAWLSGEDLLASDTLTLQLVEDIPVRGQVLDLEGRPVANAEIEVWSIQHPHSGSLDGYLKVLRDEPIREQSYRNNQLEWIWTGRMKLDVTRGTASTWENDRFLITADDEGRFEIRGIGGERLIRMHVAGEGIESLQVNVITRPEIDDKWQRRGLDEVARRMLDSGGSIPKIYPATFQHLAGPSFPVTGVVRDKDTGEPISGILVAGWLRNTDNRARATTDENGRYELKGLAVEGTFQQLYAGPSDRDPDQLPYVGAQKERISFSPSDPLTGDDTDFKLARGIVVRGRVTDAATGEPVKARVEYLGHGDNPHLAELPIPLWPYCDATTNDDGEFSIVVLPGPGSLAVWTRLSSNVPDRYRPATADVFGLPVDERGFMATTNKGLIRADHYKAARLINFETDTHADVEFQVHPVGDVVRVRCVDEQGQVIRNVIVAGHMPWMGDQVMRHGGLEVGRGEDTYIEISDLDTEDRLPVAFYHQDLEIAALLFPAHDTREPQLKNLHRDEDGAYRITLRPWGTITGRLVDADGEPVARGTGLEIALASASDSAKPIFEIDHHRIFADGRFELKHIPAGGPYLIGAGGPEHPGRVLRQIAEVKPGETIDLGTIDITAEEQPAPEQSTTDSEKDPKQQVTMRGRVVDEAGRPVPSAKVFVVRTRGNDIYHAEEQRYEYELLQEMSVDSQGYFVAEIPPLVPPSRRDALLDWRPADVVAVAPGYAAEWTTSGEEPGDREILLTLKSPPTSIHGRLVGLEGQPVAGLEVRLKFLARSEPEQVKQWIDDVESLRADGKLPLPGAADRANAFLVSSAAVFDYSDQRKDKRSAYYPGEERLRAGHFAAPSVVQTDADGRFTISGLPADQLAKLEISGPGIARHQVSVVTRRMERLPLALVTYYGSEFDHVVPPGIVVTGVVKDVETGEPLAGAAVKSHVTAGPSRMVDESFSTVTDDQGQFRLEGLPAGQGNELKVVPNADQPYLITERLEVPEGNGREPVHMEIAMRRGVFVTGRVTEESGKPVAATVHVHPYLDNPHAAKYQRFDPQIITLTIATHEPSLATRDDGTFRIVAPPGRSILAVHAVDRDQYCVGLGADEVSGLDTKQQRFATYDHCSPQIYHRLAELDIDPQDHTVTQDLSLSRGKKVMIRPVDSKGERLAGVRVSNQAPFGSLPPQSPEATLVEIVALRPAEQRPILLLHQERKLARVITVEAPQTDTTPEPRKVELQSCGTVTGWLVDGDGEPVAGMHFRAALLPSIDNSITAENVVTKEDGSFRFEYLAPGGRYMLGGYHQDFGWIELINELEIKPGETIDLGAIDATSKERPEPVRTGELVSVNEVYPNPNANQVKSSPDVYGTVVGADGKPVAGARFYWFRSRVHDLDPMTPKLLATSDENGKYKFDIPTLGIAADDPASWTYRPSIVVRAPGHGFVTQSPEGMRRAMEGPNNVLGAIVNAFAGNKGVTVKLPAAGEPIRGRIVNIDGQPVAGATVSIRWFTDEEPRGSNLRDAEIRDKQHAWWRSRVDNLLNVIEPAPLRMALPQATTDAQGRFELRDIGTGRLLQLLLEGNNIESSDVIVRNEPGDIIEIPADRHHHADARTVYPSNFLRAVGPSRPVEGQVTDLDTGKPIANAVVRAFAIHGDPLHSSREREHLAVRTDRNGRYRLTGLPKGSDNKLVAFTTGDQPYIAVGHRVDTSSESPAVQDFRLKRGVWAEGRVYDAETGKSYTGEITYHYFRNEGVEKSIPGLRDAFLDGRYWTNANGEFRVPVLPARGILAFRYDGAAFDRDGIDRYPRGYGANQIEGFEDTTESFPTRPHYLTPINYQRLAEVNPTEEETTIHVDMSLLAPKSVTVRVTDSAGRPLADYQAMGARIMWGWERQEDNEFQIEGLQKDERRKIFVYHRKRNLVGSAMADLASEGPIQITTVDAGSVSGRLIDEEGEPIADASLSPSLEKFRDDDNAAIWPPHPELIANPTTIPVDGDGRFKLDGLIPGKTYNAWASAPRKRGNEMMSMGIGNVFADVTVEPGEEKNLGDLVVGYDREEDREDASGAANADSAETPFRYAGQVVDANGQPVSGAKLYLAYWYSDQFAPARATPLATTGADGRFEFTMSKNSYRRTGDSVPPWLWGSLVAVAEGHGAAWGQAAGFETTGALVEEAKQRLQQQGQSIAEFEERLAAERGPLWMAHDLPLEGRVVDINGQPVAGARVKVVELRTGKDGTLVDWDEAIRKPDINYYEASQAADRHIYGPFVPEIFPSAVSDDDGQFTLRGLGRERLVQLVVEADGLETQEVYARGRNAESITLADPLAGSVQVHGANFTHVAAPSRPVEGVVKDADTGKPIVGVIVTSMRSGISTAPGRIERAGSDHVRAVTDGQGRYRLAGLPSASRNPVSFQPPPESSYLAASTHDVDTSGAAGSPVKLDIELSQGVVVTGRVIDAETGNGVSGQIRYLAEGESGALAAVASGRVGRDIRADMEGRFRFVAPKGSGYVAFTAFDDAYLKKASKPKGAQEMAEYALFFAGAGPEYHALAKIEPGGQQRHVEIELSVERGELITGQLLDPEGRPITASGGAYVGRLENRGWTPLDHGRFHVLNFDGGRPRQLLFVDAERKLAGKILLTAKPQAALTVKLQPTATITGRVVDDDGVPVAGLRMASGHLERLIMASPDQPPPPDPPLPLPPAEDGHSAIETDADGRFTIAGLLPGVAYDLSGHRHTSPFENLSGNIAQAITLKPGETRDLGELKLQVANLQEILQRQQAEFNAKQQKEDVSKEATSEPSLDESQQSIRIEGRVIGTDGEPVAGADVAVTAMRKQTRRGGDYRPGGEALAQAQTNSDGEFSLTLQGDLESTHTYPHLIARKEGAAIGWRRFDFKAPPTDVSIELRKQEPIRGRLVDIEGEPAANVRLYVQAILAKMQDGVRNEDGAGFRGTDPPAAWLPSVVTNDEGRFTLHGIPAGYGAMLEVTGNDRFAPQDIALNTGMPEQRGERDATYRSLVKNVGPGEEAVIALNPAQVIEGVVTYEDTGEPAPDARVAVWASQQEYGSMMSVAGQADENGRYRITPNPGIRFGVSAYPPDGVPYMARQTPLDKAIRWGPGDRVRTVDMSLPRGVLVRGTITESESRKPIAGASIKYLPESANNPNTSDDILTGWRGMQLSNQQGEFAIAVLPGPGRLLIHDPTNDYVIQEATSRELSSGANGGSRVYAHLVHKIDVQLADSPIDLSLSLKRGAKVRGTLVDETGQSVDHVTMITWRNTNPSDNGWRGHSPEVVGGRFELGGLVEGEEYPVYFLDAKRKLGAAATIRAEEPAPKVVMRPCGAATMRLVDIDGNPRPNVSAVNVYFVARAGADKYDSDAVQAGEITADSDFISNVDQTNYPNVQSTDTDEEGRIRLPVLIPGATYRIVTLKDGRFTVVKDFVVEAGQTLDLGDLVVDVAGE